MLFGFTKTKISDKHKLLSPLSSTISPVSLYLGENKPEQSPIF